ncbi:MAG: hypothetical protein QE484_02115 [Rhizobium sp.]|nr:hypothetical protein [Rhizobium sp.]
MRLESFEDWFAVRPNHSDEDEHLAGRLKFDLEDGIYLETIRFCGGAEHLQKPLIKGETLTGWLNYQQPTTLIRPWIQSFGGLQMGINTIALKENQRFVAAAILKNVFLEDVKAPIFTGLKVEHPALHAWINPCLVAQDSTFLPELGLPALSVDIQSPQKRVLTLSDKTEATVISTTRISGGSSRRLEDYTTLELRFPEPLGFDAINRVIWRISSLFEFLIGARTQASVHLLPTTQLREWNGEERHVVAELWYRPIARKRRRSSPPNEHSCFMLEKRSPISMEDLLSHITGASDETMYLASVIQSVEDGDLSIDQGYGELLGCLEAFDERTFGSGADENFKANMKRLRDLVDQHGNVVDVEFFKRIQSSASNKFSLLKRLERLHRHWVEDGFRGSPNLQRIRDLRNLVPHGRGLEVSSEVAKEMVIYNQYLAALGRYHVLKALGFTRQTIETAFLSQPNRYGMYTSRR